MKKRALIIMLALALLLTLPGCSKTAEVEEAIDAIGTVTLDDGPAIEYAEGLYNELSASEQGKVGNAATLIAARKEYDRLADAVQYCIACIEAIGEVTLDSGDAIATARAAYDALRADDIADYASQAYPVLDAAEDTYDELRAQVLYLQAQAVYAEAKELKLDENYEAAWALLDTVVTTYPETPTAALARVDAAECLMIIADKLFKAENFAATYNAVTYCAEVYGTNEQHKTLSESLFIRLEQIRPVNGRIFRSRNDSGLVRFKVIAKDKDFCLKLQRTNNPENYLMFYVRAGEEFTVHVDEGEYILKYTYGDYWFGEEEMFGSTGTFMQIQGVAQADVEYTPHVIIYDMYTEVISPDRVDSVVEITEDEF